MFCGTFLRLQLDHLSNLNVRKLKLRHFSNIFLWNSTKVNVWIGFLLAFFLSVGDFFPQKKHWLFKSQTSILERKRFRWGSWLGWELVSDAFKLRFLSVKSLRQILCTKIGVLFWMANFNRTLMILSFRISQECNRECIPFSPTQIIGFLLVNPSSQMIHSPYCSSLIVALK